ncbi:hypothetical protein SVIO_049750 [Streptomyces violaceusniger]|uniref:Uncharacterized protein n=1 Tax=Streptomyces violaceusniger TaxID=68280 RepID=A0A4D4KZT2_STRVO|nr:hypothetical protein SVIO_049750 [Streptomyces violaceusniger]
MSAPFSATAAATPSMSSLMMKGLVHCTRSTTSTVVPCDASYASIAWITAASLVAVSPAMSVGRWMTTAPAPRAAAAMPVSSVETTTSVTRRLARHSMTARATSGTPPTAARFFAGTPFDPPRAGITASTHGLEAVMAAPSGVAEVIEAVPASS